MWERWNGDQMRGDPSMNSYNHYAYGAVADWIYRYAAGIDASPQDAGFHTIYLHPTFDSRLGSLNFSYTSLYGQIKSSWTTHSGHSKWTVTLPANTKGELPLSPDRAASFTLDGLGLDKSKRVHLSTSADGGPVYELVAGTYVFDVAAEQGSSPPKD
jgi:alpha-L-rhamnosidase